MEGSVKIPLDDDHGEKYLASSTLVEGNCVFIKEEPHWDEDRLNDGGEARVTSSPSQEGNCVFIKEEPHWDEVMEDNEDDFSDTSAKPGKRKSIEECSENSQSEIVSHKRIKTKEKVDVNTTDQVKQERKKELAKLRKIRYLERQKNIEKDKINRWSTPHSKELARQRSQRYRDKKRIDLLNCARNNEKSTVDVESKVENENKICSSPHSKELARQRSKKYRDKKRVDCMSDAKSHEKSTVDEEIVVKNQIRSDNMQIPGTSWFDSKLIQTNDSSTNLKKSNCMVSKNIDSNSDSDSNKQNIDNLPTIYQQNMNVNLEISKGKNLQEVNISEPKKSNIQPVQRYKHNQPSILPQRYTMYNAHSSAHLEFAKQFLLNDFGHACSICDRLCYKNDLKYYKNDESTKNIQLIRTLLTNVEISIVKVCKTCYKSIREKKIPPLSVYNGFKYPPYPDHLKCVPLDLVSERLISPRLPFKQVRRLRHVNGQHGIYGQVINVPLEVDTMVNQLPRTDDDDDCINVNIERKKIFKTSDVCGVVQKQTLKQWLEYLITTPLFKAYNVTIDEQFFEQNCTIDNEGDEELGDISEDIPIEESLVALQQTLMWNKIMYLQIAPGENNVPINVLFDELAEELSFPAIYLGQIRNFKEGLCVSPFMMATSEIRRSDRRGVTPHHLLYMAMNVMRIRVREALKDNNITKEQVKDENFLQGSNENSFGFLCSIPNSTWYWQERKKDLFAMIRQLGKPTVFFTISANEIGWPHLLKLLFKLKNGENISLENAEKLHFMTKSSLVNDDAVTCAIYFNKLLEVILQLLQSKKYTPFKKFRVLHYFKRIEFQPSGRPLAHILAWLDNAPENALEEDYNKAVELIDTLISVSSLEASGNIKLQTHKHSFTCYQETCDEKAEKCRFDAPFMPSKKTMILTPMKDMEGYETYKKKYIQIRQNLENIDYTDMDDFYEQNGIVADEEYINIKRAGINRPTVFLKRQPNEKWHNPFNPFILNLVQSNSVFQFITEEYTCASFIVEYMNKINEGFSNLHQKIIETMNEHPEYDVMRLFQSSNNDLLNRTEMTSEEAAWYLLKQPMSKTSTSIVYIPTVWPIERQRKVKTKRELIDLEDDSIDIWKENWFDKYEKRPDYLEKVSLAQFVSKYYKSYKGDYLLRSDPRVARYRNYDMADDLNEYKREMVTLHIPFRHEESEVLSEMKFIEIYEANESRILQSRKEFESDIDIAKIIQICQELSHEETQQIEDDIDNTG